LYTLVYGAMPFDGSNFKRLVKQISAGDYYEPKKPAEASHLIRRMLTVDAAKRANVDDICSHPWINQGFDSDCLKNAEDLAKQTPVRLDVLLTLAPNHNSIPANNHAPSEDGVGASSNHKDAGGAAAAGESNTDISEPPKKPKLQNDKAAAAESKEKGMACVDFLRT
jgi:serine/threonine protein kinase